MKDLPINLQARSLINILFGFTVLIENLSYSLKTHFYSCGSFAFRLAADLLYHIALSDIKFFSERYVFRMPGIYTHIFTHKFEECLFVTHSVIHFQGFLYRVCMFDHWSVSFRVSCHEQLFCFID